MCVDHAGGGEDLLGLGQFVLDAGLFASGQVFGYGAGDDAPRQSLAFRVQFGDPGTGVSNLRRGSALLVVQFGPQPGSHRLLNVLR